MCCHCVLSLLFVTNIYKLYSTATCPLGLAAEMRSPTSAYPPHISHTFPNRSVFYIVFIFHSCNLYVPYYTHMGKKFKKYCCKLVVGTICTPYMYLKELRSNKPLKKKYISRASEAAKLRSEVYLL
jgi:hypothetical protein